MSKPLPLIGLRAFVEVGRQGSIQAAAKSLSVTPGAVSQQVKHVEQYLNATLFDRNNRALKLTSAGHRLFNSLTEAFQTIDDAIEPFHLQSPPHHLQQTLKVTTNESFAATWLVPRLQSFYAQHPKIEVTITTTPEPIDLLRETQIDIALRHGLGNYRGLESIKVLTPKLIPVCSPDLIQPVAMPRQPIDLLNFPLLQDCDHADWLLWFRALGIRDGRAARGPCYSNDNLLTQAAIGGQGIALVRDTYVSREIQRGSLVLALDEPSPSAFAYYLVARPETIYKPKVQSFIKWILHEAGM